MSKSNTFNIKLVKNRKGLMQVFKIRRIVFINEKKVAKDAEKDKFDFTSKHVVAIYNNNPVGCARIRFIGKKAKLERIAVLKRHRGKGFGKLIVNYLIKYCKNNKANEIFMNSQYYLKDYYGRLGFKPKGKPFMEADIKHLKMYYKKLQR